MLSENNRRYVVENVIGQVANCQDHATTHSNAQAAGGLRSDEDSRRAKALKLGIFPRYQVFDTYEGTLHCSKQDYVPAPNQRK